MVNYFKLRYLAMETFYKGLLDENYVIKEIADRCFDEFQEKIDKNDIESAIIISIILSGIAIYEKETLNYFIKYYNQMMEILEKIDLDEYLINLSKEEKEDYFLDDIGFIKECFEKMDRANKL